jgi:hypothetical protein
LHRSGLIHRDIHPGNIIVMDGVAKISDMEFVKERDVRTLGNGTLDTTKSLQRVVTEVRTVRSCRTSFQLNLTIDIDQGSLFFAAVEAIVGEYLFRQADKCHDPEDEQDQPGAKLDELESMLGQPSPEPEEVAKKAGLRRIFLHTPLHDYESVWWIATWVLFKCTPKSLSSEESARFSQLQASAMEWIFDNQMDRQNVMTDRAEFPRFEMSLPPVLHPLFRTLCIFRTELAKTYVAYEESFDGSVILPKVALFCRCLELPARLAAKVEIQEFPQPSTLDPSTMRLRLPPGVDGDQGAEVVTLLRVTPGDALTPKHQSNGIKTTPALLEKRKAGSPLDPPVAKIRLLSEQRRA